MSWIERHLDDLAADGWFDALPGSGLPISSLDEPYEPTWWAARWVSRDAALQSSAELRERLADDVAAALQLPRPAARQRLESISRAVAALNERLDTPNRLPAVDVETILIRGDWSADA